MKPENIKCPECSGPMISRNGKFGPFWGCKDYPNCKGTRDSMGRSKADREAERSTEDRAEQKWYSSPMYNITFKKDWEI